MNQLHDILFTPAEVAERDFSFGPETAEVFEDMLARSIPFYDEIQKMTSAIGKAFAREESNIYDLGCSTGTTILHLARAIGKGKVNFIGIDSSEAMVQEAKMNINQAGLEQCCLLSQADLNNGFPIRNASVVVLNLTLHFIRPINRENLLTEIYKGLRKDGCLIFTEKILAEDPVISRTFIGLYHDYKASQGYSRFEIDKKRIALENVLIPYHFNENVRLLRNSGFSAIEEFFRWYNFSGLIAIKKQDADKEG